jgi:Fis family transcriptional regulator
MSTSTTIQDSIRKYLEQYFAELGNEQPSNVYDMMLDLIERPLLEEVMKRAGNNQCRATRYLGLARGTVIKKLKQYGLIKSKSRASQSVREEALV